MPTKTPVIPQERATSQRVTLEIPFLYPDGTKGVGYARVHPAVSEKTIEALREMLTKAAAMDRDWKAGDPKR